jgi:hypothetical protein
MGKSHVSRTNTRRPTADIPVIEGTPETDRIPERPRHELHLFLLLSGREQNETGASSKGDTCFTYEGCPLAVNTKVKRAAGRLLSLKLAPCCGQIGVTTKCNVLYLNLLQREAWLQSIVSF